MYVMKKITHTSATCWKPSSLIVFPSSGIEILAHTDAFAELCRLANFAATRNGLDADDLGQDVAFRIFRRDPRVPTAADWSGLCATVARNLCRDFWRREYSRNFEFHSADEEIFEGYAPLENEASLMVLGDALHREEMERVAALRDTVLVRLAASSSRLPRGLYCVMVAMLQNKDNPEIFKLNGKLNGNALARLSGIAQSTISRAIQPIREAACEMLQEMEIDI